MLISSTYASLRNSHSVTVTPWRKIKLLLFFYYKYSFENAQIFFII